MFQALKKTEVIQFLADTDQFFLNIAMATGKSNDGRGTYDSTWYSSHCNVP